MNKKKIFFADFFAGIGGFHHAIKNIAKKERLNIDFICSLVSEIDYSAKLSYSKKFKYDFKKIKDINLIEPKKDMHNIELVFCGFPCQTFSNAGKKLGFNDEIKGTLIFKVIEIIKESKPKFLLLENVKHIVNHDQGRTFKRIISEFEKIGYITTEKPIVISPLNLGIPQNRDRVFIPLIHNSLINLKNLPQIEIPNLKLKNYKKYLDNVVENSFYLTKEEQDILNAWEVFVEHFRNKKIKIPTLWLDEMLNKEFVTNSKAINTEWYKKYINDMNTFYSDKENKEFIDKWVEKFKPLNWRLRKYKKLEWQAGFDISFKDAFLQQRQSGLRFKKNNFFPTLVATVQTPCIYDKTGWRKLTLNEVAKLQDLPNFSIETMNEFQIYKQYGNSVNVKVVEWVIMNYLLNYLKEI